jgi:Transglutaminase-like superfamily
VMAARLPPLLLAWHRASRARRRSGPGARRARRGARPGHCLHIRPRVIAGTSWWTLRMWWRVHRRLDGGIRGRGVRAAPALLPAPTTPHSRRAARLTLACCRATCLERALIRQARAAGAGMPRDVIVGVTAPATGFRAHAWLDGDRVEPGFVELWRYPAATTVPSGQLRRGAS